ncbi:hypothetical protein M011DRAFT_5275 [Sporormia fimetaria CBS 119925]|uniref:F-box domain-containing protein n=1 Tax=Sporormia fimetaria CBS 119925 TaxID=1340428 RepID=A0A6A6VMF5_9PLEO|nr:hypothetical protein M011DRAFT_5275 [Sporormia fimetaria CBS 119925]
MPKRKRGRHGRPPRSDEVKDAHDPRSANPVTLWTIPPELPLMVYQYLEQYDLRTMARCCKLFNVETLPLLFKRLYTIDLSRLQNRSAGIQPGPYTKLEDLTPAAVHTVSIRVKTDLTPDSELSVRVGELLALFPDDSIQSFWVHRQCLFPRSASDSLATFVRRQRSKSESLVVPMRMGSNTSDSDVANDLGIYLETPDKAKLFLSPGCH